MENLQKPLSQKQALLSLLEQGTTLNILSAFQETGCFHLPTRISNYTKLGYQFKKEKVVFTTRFGTQGYYFNYTMTFNPFKKIENVHN